MTDIFTVSGVGDGVADDTAAFATAINAALANGAGEVYVPHPPVAYKVTASLPYGDNIRIRSQRGTLIKPSGSNLIVFNPLGTVGYSLTLRNPIDKWHTGVPVVSAAGVSVSDVLYFDLAKVFLDITYADGSHGTGGASFISTVTGFDATDPNTILIDDPLPFDVGVNDTLTIRQVTKFIERFAIEGLSFDLSGCTGASFAICGSYLKHCSLRDIQGKNATTAGLISLGAGGWFTSIKRLYAENCGSSGYQDINIGEQTHGDFEAICSERASGFGPALKFNSHCSSRGVHSIYANGRGIRIAGNHSCDHEDYFCTKSFDSGISLTGSTQDCNLRGMHALKCDRQQGDGFWMNGEYNTSNTVTGLNARGCSHANIYIGTNDTGNRFALANYDLPIQNFGGATFI